ncbi:hypothetical protein JIN77_05060 [Verrucomicrobiaceae bacterium R5-34]|nr:hypothetical protein [Verrucomicrobiaceae bacterium R5-34]
MIEIRPQRILVLLTNYRAFLSSVFVFAIWKWILDWPAPWIAFFLIARATYLSFLHYPKLTLQLTGSTLTGPSGPTYQPTTLVLDAEHEITTTFGLTIIKGSCGKEIWYREGWYPSKAIDALNRHLSRIRATTAASAEAAPGNAS